ERGGRVSDQRPGRVGRRAVDELDHGAVGRRMLGGPVVVRVVVRLLTVGAQAGGGVVDGAGGVPEQRVRAAGGAVAGQLDRVGGAVVEAAAVRAQVQAGRIDLQQLAAGPVLEHDVVEA